MQEKTLHMNITTWSIPKSYWFSLQPKIEKLYKSEIVQLCPTLSDPMDCSPPGSSIHGIFQARVLEWVAISFSRDLPNPGIELGSPILQADTLPSEPPEKEWSSIQSTKTRPGADSGSDHELLISKFRLKMKKVGKTTRPFRYDLNQIPCDYTVEVRNRFKGLDLIDWVPEELWTEVCDIVQEAGIKTIPKKKKCKKAKWLSEEAL